jgi:ABC-type Fe3+ transport system permease subunit
MNLIPYIAVWVVLALIVIVLAVQRIREGKREDATLHVLESQREVEQQSQMTKKIARIERWGQALTIVVVLYGLVLAGVYVYHVWQASAKIPE